LTINVDRPQLSPEDIHKLQAAMIEKAKADWFSGDFENLSFTHQ
jgi:hypothetical protein